LGLKTPYKDRAGSLIDPDEFEAPALTVAPNLPLLRVE